MRTPISGRPNAEVFLSGQAQAAQGHSSLDLQRGPTSDMSRKTDGRCPRAVPDVPSIKQTVLYLRIPLPQHDTRLYRYDARHGHIFLLKPDCELDTGPAGCRTMDPGLRGRWSLADGPDRSQ